MNWSMILKLPCSHFFCQYGELSSVRNGVHWKLGCTGNFNSDCCFLRGFGCPMDLPYDMI